MPNNHFKRLKCLHCYNNDRNTHWIKLHITKTSPCWIWKREKRPLTWRPWNFTWATLKITLSYRGRKFHHSRAKSRWLLLSSIELLLLESALPRSVVSLILPFTMVRCNFVYCSCSLVDLGKSDALFGKSLKICWQLRLHPLSTVGLSLINISFPKKPYLHCIFSSGCKNYMINYLPSNISRSFFTLFFYGF